MNTILKGFILFQYSSAEYSPYFDLKFNKQSFFPHIKLTLSFVS